MGRLTDPTTVPKLWLRTGSSCPIPDLAEARRKLCLTRSLVFSVMSGSGAACLSMPIRGNVTHDRLTDDHLQTLPDLHQLVGMDGSRTQFRSQDGRAISQRRAVSAVKDDKDTESSQAARMIAGEERNVD